MSYHDYTRMLRRRWLLTTAVLMVLSAVLGFALAQAAPIAYDLLMIRATRAGDTQFSPLPDTTRPLGLPPGSQLVRWHHATGLLSIVVDAGPTGAVFDPIVSLDGQWVGYSLCLDVKNVSVAGPLEGCSLYKKHLTTGETVLLVDHHAWNPLESYATWSKVPHKSDPPGTAHMGQGVYHMGMAWLPAQDGKDHFLFTSNRAGLRTIKVDGTNPISMQLWRYDDGAVSQVWAPPTIILHPVLRPDGRIMFSTLENSLQGDNRRWGLWEMRPDGTDWGPSFSATKDPDNIPHFCTGTTRNSVVCTMYYPLNNLGFGTLLEWPIPGLGSASIQAPFFGPPSRKLNPRIPMGGFPWQYAYTPVGLHQLTEWTFQDDRNAPQRAGVYVGKLSHPWQAPGGLLVSYSAGPVHSGTVPTVNSGIYLVADGAPTDGPEDLIEVIKPDPAFNLIMPRPVLPWAAIYGVPPKDIPPLANDGTLHASLPAGTPFALVTSPTVCYRESIAGQGPAGWKGQRAWVGATDEFVSTNFDSQGADTKPDIACTDIAAIRFVVQGGIPLLMGGDPASGLFNGTFFAQNTEARQVLGEVPLHKPGVLDPAGNPDTSFLARIPAGVSWTLELVDSKGRTLAHSPTWHQAQPGEMINGCEAGCHTHAKVKQFNRDQVVAGKPGFAPTDLTTVALRTSEFKADVAPLLTTYCASCHTGGGAAPGGLDLADTTLSQGIPRNASVFVRNHNARWGGKISPYGANGFDGHYANGYTSRWTHAYAAVKGLLSWVLHGERTDGFTNSDFLSEPWPAGTKLQQMDLDYTDAIKTAHASLAMSAAEKWVIDHWVDEGMPVDTDPTGTRGWRSDVWRPTLSWFDAKVAGGTLVFGAYDVGTGIDVASLAVTRDGAVVIPQAIADSRWELPRVPGRYLIRVTDRVGNTRELVARVPGPTGLPLEVTQTWQRTNTTLTCVASGQWRAESLTMVDACVQTFP